jgi:DNA-binding CsgD family transcriptional regulator
MDRAKLKEFAATQLNKDVMLLAMQGCTPRQMAANLGVGHGTVQAIVIKANELLGNGGDLSATALGESLRAMQREMRERVDLSEASEAADIVEATQ